MYPKFDPGTYHTFELYTQVMETEDLSLVWAYKNARTWGVAYEPFHQLCKPTCSCCNSKLDYGLGKNNKDKADVNTPSTDHIVPRSAGGTNDISNLWIICVRCNTLKNNSTPDDIHRYQRLLEVQHIIKENQEKGLPVSNNMLV